MLYSRIRSGYRFSGGLLTAFLLCACESEPPEELADSTVADPLPAADAEVSGPADACVALPASDVQNVLGEPVRDSLALKMPDGEGPATLSQCNYATSSNPAVASLLLRRSYPGESPETASQSVRETLTESGIGVEDVPGLGEIAFWGGNQLHVFANQDWYIVISPVPSGGLAQARSLADLTLPRL